MEALKHWIRCLAGLHEWVVFEASSGESFCFCAWCGERDDIGGIK